MIAELGHFALWMALAVSAVQSLAGLLGAARADRAWMRTGFNAANAQFALVVTAFVALATAFVGNDFTLVNVANNSNTNLPTAYRIAASWGSHEGSLLMWALMLAGWTAAVNAFGGTLPQVLRARVIGVLGLVAIGFLDPAHPKKLMPRLRRLLLRARLQPEEVDLLRGVCKRMERGGRR